MKRTIPFLICLLAPGLVRSQLPDFKWARNMGGSSSVSVAFGVATDKGGNVYSTGLFTGTVDFDPGSGTANLTSSGGADVFVSKLDASGNFVWARKIGGSATDEGRSIAVDASGNVFITGGFQSTVDFDPGSGTFNLSSVDFNNIFILKLDASGNFAWAKSMGGILDDKAYAIALDATGNIYTTGTFAGTADFDPGADSLKLTAPGIPGYTDIFISKLNSSGGFVWARNIGGASSDDGNAIAVDAGGNVYTTGTFIGTADFDPGAAVVNLTDAGISDIYVSKLDASGNFVWARRMGGTMDDVGRSIAVDALGNIYTTGTFDALVDFDPGAGTYNLTTFGEKDIFISKLGSSGNFVWARQLGGIKYDFGSSVRTDVYGNVYCAGNFTYKADFDPGPDSFYLSSAGVADVFVSRFDPMGNFAWAKQMGGISLDEARGIAITPMGNIVTAGWMAASGDYDPGSPVYNLTLKGTNDMFVHKMGQGISGLSENTSINHLAVFPNPSGGIFQIQLSNPAEVTVEIYNSLGVLMYKQSCTNQEEVIDLSHQSHGLYIVKVMEGQQLVGIQKIVIHSGGSD